MMKRRLLLLPLSLLLLSCGSASSSMTPEEYFSLAKSAAEAGLSDENLQLTHRDGRGNFAFSFIDGEGAEHPISGSLSGFGFDERFSGLTETDPKNLLFSMETSSSSSLRLQGISVDSGGSMFGGGDQNVPLVIGAYGQDGVGYLNLTDASKLRLALNLAGKAMSEEYHNLPAKAKMTLSEEDLSSLGKRLPLKEKLISASKSVITMFQTAKEALPSSVTTEGEDQKSITLLTTRKEDLRTLIDAFHPERINDSISSSFDVSSILDQMFDSFDLDQLYCSLSFNESGWTSVDYHVSLRFTEENQGITLGDAMVIPTGSWSFSGSTQFAHGASAALPKTLTSREKTNAYEEYAFPALS